MSGGRYAKGLPEFIYFVCNGNTEDDWVQGPYVRPQKYSTNRKFKLVEVPMDKPKIKIKK